MVANPPIVIPHTIAFFLPIRLRNLPDKGAQIKEAIWQLLYVEFNVSKIFEADDTYLMITPM